MIRTNPSAAWGHRGAISAVVSLLLVAGALTGCGSNAPTDSVGQPEFGPADTADVASCPAGGDLTTAADILPDLLPGDAELFAWQTYMVGLGPRFDGSPALKQWHDFLADKLAGYGLDVQREPMPIDWWDHRHWSLKLVENGVETEVAAAAYYPYSGFTPEGGIVADAADVGMGLATDFETADVNGKIAFFDMDLLPMKMGFFYGSSTYVYDPDQTMTPATDYTRMSLSIIAPQVSLIQPAQTRSLYFAQQGGAVGAVISVNASPENMAGQYTPFNGHPGANFEVPTLYVDRVTGDLIKARVALGAKLRLELVVEEHLDDATDDIIATLPGTNPDEYIIINTHTDGTSASEENGGIAVLALAQYFAALPQQCRQRSLAFVLTPGHFHGGIGGDTDRFIENHPEIISKAVGSLTPEHLGQMEWLDDALGYHPSGLVEPAVFYGSPTAAMQAIMANAVTAEDLRRVIVSRPVAGTQVYFGVGSALNSNGVPNAGYLTGPHALYSFAANQHLDHTDAARMAQEVRTFARVAATLDAMPTATLCAGMPPANSGAASGCSPAP